VAGSANRLYEFWFGTTGGGVYKTTDGGNTWLPASDKYFGGTVGAIGVSESNPDVVYVGTGEYDIRGNVSPGNGVYKTVDGGRTWTSVGLAETRQIARVRVHPTRPDVVWVAAQGHAFGPNADRGVYKTTDGGSTWRKVLFRNDSTGATDLVLDPTNPDLLYASLWQGQRFPWALISGGSGSGIFKSTDGGESWTEITHNPGLPRGVLGMIALAVSPAKPSRIWAQVEADSGGVYRSDDAGATWRRVNQDHKLRQRAWYFSRIFADPKDSNVVYGLNTNVYRSSDGGVTFRHIRDPHGDNHDLWIAPNDPQRMIESNDGGANVSYNGGKTWTEQDQATAQFYHVSTTTHFPYRVCGAQQDNSAMCGPSRWPGGIDIAQWYDPGGGESGFVESRPDDPDIVYAGDNSGQLTRLDHRTGLLRIINVWPDEPDGHPAADERYRFQWTAPIHISPHDPHVLYTGGNMVFRSTNEGQSWVAISPDLTRHDPRTLGISGGPITSDQTTAEYYATVFALAESPVQKGLIWAGSDDGLIHVTRDDGKTWTDVSIPGLPEWSRISIIEPSHFAACTAYAATNHYQMDDPAPFIWRTADCGKSWTKIVNGIPATDYARAVREDPVKRGLLYAGTERGVWVSFDDGANWQSIRRNLPIVPVHDLAVKEGDLVAATHGRSFWILDDITPLRQLTTSVLAKPLHLFRPRPAYQVQWGTADAPAYRPVGENPPAGAMIYFWLAQPGQEVTLDILDSRHRLIQRYSSHQDTVAFMDSLAADSVHRARTDSLRRAGVAFDTSDVSLFPSDTTPSEDKPWPQPVSPPPRVPDKQGLNMFAWNLRYPDVAKFTGMENISTDGPMAVPGTYWVRVRAGSRVDSASFEIKPDPRSKATPEDLRQQFAFLRAVRDTATAGVNALLTMRNVRAQLADRMKRLAPSDTAALGPMARSLADTLSAIEEALYQPRTQSDEDNLNYPSRLIERISSVGGDASTLPARPTDQMRSVYAYFTPQLQKQLLAYQSVLRTELPKVNAALKKVGAPPIVPSTTEIAKPAHVAMR